ncbi:Trehalose and maltose hydrolase (possible phosphorylase) [Streptosporangium canum]|uniref:Trehalose and maltose hydrolase (Possible phosphorylase) n=1 Tax=Streptosporangium canum TaxID=324952 RepID=A0A1I3V0Y2_9ACTN|nr:glycoside hydrolase family 65 protein [Streptosporangium canum]SFJ88609.1 Trehalose and maltose hydrolase (possible phosphorylase) [Streptosporangium canum]
MNPWLLTYDGFDPAQEGLREALTTLGNGYFATRGAAPESRADEVHYPGTYVAGCYDRLISRVAGHSVENEDLVNAPNWLPLTFRADRGDWFAPGSAEILADRRTLDMRQGVLTRLLRTRDSRGRITRLEQHRLVSMDDPHLAALTMTIVPENWSGSLEIRSSLDGRVTNAGVARYRGLADRHLVPIRGHAAHSVIELLTRTATSRVEIALAARTTVAGGRCRTGVEESASGDDQAVREGWVSDERAVEVKAGEGVTVEKVVALYTSRDRAVAGSTAAARTAVVRAGGFSSLLKRHVRAWDRLWQRAHVTAEDAEVQQILNLYLFHLLQTASPHVAELDAGLPARGLHGEAYRGHVFWDDLFAFPFLAPRFPDITQALLRYRWRRLPEARWAARAAGHTGAMFPWQSGSDGREETPRLHLNPRSGRWLPDRSHLQRHVGLAVAYNVWQHYRATKDTAFLAGFGGELLLEVARFFASIATCEQGRYTIRGVMGPDEYHDGYPGRTEPGLDNNAYTNTMTAWLMRRVLDMIDLVGAEGVSRQEIDLFTGMSRRMRVDFHDGVISQFEGYGELQELDWTAYREKYTDIRRLDRILEAEGDTPNRYKVSKQADVLMLLHLLGEEGVGEILTGLGYEWNAEMAARTVDYYLARTCHGSTLSAVVHAGVLARLHPGASHPFLVEALNNDVKDLQGGTTAEGIHLGAMAGVVCLFETQARA